MRHLLLREPLAHFPLEDARASASGDQHRGVKRLQRGADLSRAKIFSSGSQPQLLRAPPLSLCPISGQKRHSKPVAL